MAEYVSIPGEPSAPALVMRHRPAAGDAPPTEGRVVLYIQGATFPGSHAIGFRFDGWSWMDDLSAVGFDVWALDVAGFGASERYPAMDAPADAHPPLGRAPEVSAQIARAVDAITARQGVARVHLLAHSWGTLVAGHFATHAPEHVDRLVLFGPITRRDGPLPPGPLPAYRDITLDAQWRRFTEDVPAGAPPVLLRRHFDAWGRAYLATDATSGTRSPASVRIPGGPQADILAAWGGTFPYDPAAVRAPTLLVRGEWDSLATDADARWLFDALTAAPTKLDVKIGRATHLMHLEDGRHALYRTVRSFLAGDDAPPDGGASRSV